LKIVVLMGGLSAERDVSLASGEAIVSALKSRGHQVWAIDTAEGKKFLPQEKKNLPEGVKTTPPNIKELKKIDSKAALETIEHFDFSDVDVIFLALHGGQGEDGTIQALLDLSGKPYTGSKVLASALAMDKAMSKKIFEREKILTPGWILLINQSLSGFSQIKKEIKDSIGYPLVVKPNNQGSTVGLTIVKEENCLEDAIKTAQEYGEEVLLEKYVSGRELTVGILDNQPLPVVEIIPEHGIYDYECKYTKGKSQYVCPAKISEKKRIEIQEMALKAFVGLKCEGYARVDFRYGEDDEIYCLEVNTLPGMTSTSLVPKAAQAIGIEFNELVERIARLALKKPQKI
jgi:D-alanine-D-alanine ligase